MTPVELTLMVASTLGGGALLAIASYVRDIRNDAATALRILTGEEEIDGDGLVHVVEVQGEAIAENRERIEEHSQQIDRLTTAD